jgi:hypothetical protein
MSRRVVAALAVVAVCVAAGLVALGRWEGNRHADEEMRGMRRVLAAIGPLDNPSLSMYRVHVGFGFDCLLYKRGTNRFALEVCFDNPGRVIETIDRRGAGDPKISSLREDPGASKLRIDRALADRLLKRLGAPGY